MNSTSTTLVSFGFWLIRLTIWLSVIAWLSRVFVEAAKSQAPNLKETRSEKDSKKVTLELTEVGFGFIGIEGGVRRAERL